VNSLQASATIAGSYITDLSFFHGHTIWTIIT